MSSKRKYYAATLKGDNFGMSIDKVFCFSYPSQRNQWTTESYGTAQRVKLISKIAKKHKDIVRVDYRLWMEKWGWMYNNTPENLFEL